VRQGFCIVCIAAFEDLAPVSFAVDRGLAEQVCAPSDYCWTRSAFASNALPHACASASKNEAEPEPLALVPPVTADKPLSASTRFSSFASPAFRTRVAELGIPYETIDALAGWTSTYASKLLAEDPIKFMGPMSLDAMMAQGVDFDLF
jgi:hypothetical protein